MMFYKVADSLKWSSFSHLSLQFVGKSLDSLFKVVLYIWVTSKLLNSILQYTVECPFFYFRVRKISTFTAFLDVFWLNYALLRIQSCRSKALINAQAYLRILLNLHFAIDKLENSYKRLIFQPSPLWTAALHRFSSEDLSNKHPPTHLTIGKQLDSNSQK